MKAPLGKDGDEMNNTATEGLQGPNSERDYQDIEEKNTLPVTIPETMERE